MELSRFNKCVLVLSLLLGVCSVFVSGLPQWVWNPDAETGPKNSIGSGNRLVFGGKEKPNIKLDETQARLFLPSIVNAITGGGRPGNRPRPTTSRPSSSSSGGGSDGSSSSNTPPATDNNNSGGGGGNGGGGSGGQGEGQNGGGSCNTGACIGGSIASQAIEQGINAGTSIAENNSIFGNFLQNIFGGNSATTLPAGIGGGSGGGSSGGSGAQCTCEDRSRGCFLPARETGSCDSGTRIQCCTSTRGSRTVFPEDNFSSTSSNNNVRTVTRSQIRRALLKNIVRGSGSIVDDTLDLILHPFLTKEDQLKVATRVLSDE